MSELRGDIKKLNKSKIPETIIEETPEELASETHVNVTNTSETPNTIANPNKPLFKKNDKTLFLKRTFNFITAPFRFIFSVFFWTVELIQAYFRPQRKLRNLQLKNLELLAPHVKTSAFYGDNQFWFIS
ncbi:hypothetical protein [Candidatus Williamhamiltonella defendens]|uniref:Uncharacterized protein n=1 Tax=Candidatus Williamhamiltonella defendens TaxID=138072 RepID=A0A2D3TCX1_9ENTR|nr:hypothetical protein [Candidatus Hamiltonella defensa]ATW33666.1 hypothetical protein BJP43_04530 [Candidatus Hamiltonella defensa]AYB48314.1 hypothetical protein CJJ19_00860 [Candidatus Hamiltonella defensa]